MLRSTVAGILCGVLGFFLTAVGYAQTGSSATDNEADLHRLLENADDVAGWQAFFQRRFGEFARDIDHRPEEAEQQLVQLNHLLAGVIPKSAAAKSQKTAAIRAIQDLQRRLAVSRISFEQFVDQLKSSPDSDELVRQLGLKAYRDIARSWQRDPELAAARYAQTLSVLTAGREATTAAEAIRAYEAQFAILKRCSADIERGRQLAKLVGTPAPPLVADFWLGSSPQTLESLRGKVVVLNFWSVWSGPSHIAFPYLRDWQKNYSERGLVILGITRYHSYRWDAEKRRPVAAEGTAPVDEQAMLAEFARYHQLAYPLAIAADSRMAEQYGVSSSPQIVILDQEGKIRLVRTGTAAENFADAEQVLQELLAAQSINK